MAELTTLRLSELTQHLEGFFEKRFGDRPLLVIAEVNSHKAYPDKGWHFFDLIEKDKASTRITARMSAVAWRPAYQRIAEFERQTGQRFSNGIEVMVKVLITFTGQYGMKLNVLDIDPAYTLGQMEQQRRETLLRLVKNFPQHIRIHEGSYITRNQGLQLPGILRRIAVISSPTAAGYEDFMHTLAENNYGYRFRIDFYQARVQGSEAAYLLSRRLLEISMRHEEYDLVVLIRGGGAQTDLFVFDDYVLNREIARMKVPLWTGIGHQRDSTIADLFCHTQFKTPTRVAEAIVQYNRSAEESLLDLRQRAIASAREGVKSQQQWLANKSLKISSELPRQLRKRILEVNAMAGRMQGASLNLLRQRKSDLRYLRSNFKTHARHGVALGERSLSEVRTKLTKASTRVIEEELVALAEIKARTILGAEGLIQKQKEALDRQVKVLKLLSPDQTLRRGYALVLREGKVLGPNDHLEKGAQISLRTSAQEVDAEVLNTKMRESSEGID